MPQLLDNTISLRLIEETTVEPISLQEAKDFLRITHDEEDAVIQLLISSARTQAEARTGRALTASTWEWVVSGIVGKQDLPITPCTACTSIVVGGETVDTSLYKFIQGDIDPLYGSITALDDFPEGEATITLVAGYANDSFPANIKRWILCKVSDGFEQRESYAIGTNIKEYSRNFVDSLLDPFTVVSL